MEDAEAAGVETEVHCDNHVVATLDNAVVDRRERERAQRGRAVVATVLRIRQAAPRFLVAIDHEPGVVELQRPGVEFRPVVRDAECFREHTSIEPFQSRERLLGYFGGANAGLARELHPEDPKRRVLEVHSETGLPDP